MNKAEFEGQRKEVNVGDYVRAAALGQLLKNLEFPTDKNKIIQFVQLQEQPINISKEKKEDILYILLLSYWFRRHHCGNKILF